MANNRYLNAKEAAAALEISVPTLYAYVSRGLIRSEVGTDKSRARRYRVEDVAALQSRKEMRRNPAKAAATALHFGQPVLESAITLIENGRLYYRGYDVTALPQAHSFEAVVGLIWQGELSEPPLFAKSLPEHLWQRVQQIIPLLDGLAPVERFQVALPWLAAYDLAAYDLGETAVIQTGVRLLQIVTAVVAGCQSQNGVADALQRAWLPHDTQVTVLLNMALIFCADHELNVSSFAARTAASAQATPYAVVSAGLAALRGRLHGGATEQVAAFFQEVGTPERARQVIANRLKRGDPIPGFNHPLYPDGDPRGRALLDGVTAVYPDSPAVELAKSLETAVADTIGYLPTIDTALVALAQAAQLPGSAPLTLFALGRTVGWIGQALEQYHANQLIRPRAKYTGERPRE
ncbi:MAG: MerR family transcriptional regulator [Chloroflexi bacterium]|nr:MerR family transcriptional regulator [Chloroflexota bacterium]